MTITAVALKEYDKTKSTSPAIMIDSLNPSSTYSFSSSVTTIATALDCHEINTVTGYREKNR